jgi:hypothetical protein
VNAPVSIESLLAMMGLAFAACVTCYTSWLHYRQIRQLELRRQHADVPNVRHHYLEWLNSYWVFVVSNAIAVFALYSDIPKTDILTTRSTVSLIIDSSVIALNILVTSVFVAMHRLTRVNSERLT